MRVLSNLKGQKVQSYYPWIENDANVAPLLLLTRCHLAGINEFCESRWSACEKESSILGGEGQRGWAALHRSETGGVPRTRKATSQ